MDITFLKDMPAVVAASKVGAPKLLTTPEEALRCKHCGKRADKCSCKECLTCHKVQCACVLQSALLPTGRVDEKEGSGLSKMLTELNLADMYLHKWKSEGVDINDLKETLKHGGREALERLLEEVCVDKPVHRHRLANHLGESFQLMQS
jgi:hypothetical protein